MRPALSIKQVQLDGVPIPDEDDMSFRWYVVLRQLGQAKFEQFRGRHPEVVLLIQSSLQNQHNEPDCCPTLWKTTQTHRSDQSHGGHERHDVVIVMMEIKSGTQHQQGATKA